MLFFTSQEPISQGLPTCPHYQSQEPLSVNITSPGYHLFAPYSLPDIAKFFTNFAFSYKDHLLVAFLTVLHFKPTAHNIC